MQLNDENLEAWARVVRGDDVAGEVVRGLRDALRADPRWGARRRLRLDGDGRVAAFVSLAEVGPGHLVLHDLRVREDAVREADLVLIHEAVDQARAEGARWLEARLTLALEDERLARGLRDAGGLRHGGRVEYRTPIDTLPTEAADTGLVWRAGASTLLRARCSPRPPLAPLRGRLAPRPRSGRWRPGSPTPHSPPIPGRACTSARSTGRTSRWSWRR